MTKKKKKKSEEKFRRDTTSKRENNRVCKYNTKSPGALEGTKIKKRRHAGGAIDRKERG